MKANPGGTITIPGDDVGRPPRSAGPVVALRIRDNDIRAHGGCGISVAHWFQPDPEARIEELDDIEIREAEIDDNRIHNCMRIDLAQALPVDAAFNSGYGGIALSSVADLVIDDNEIRGCGNGPSPICGIYLRFAERLRITRNRISDNGRPASLTDPLLVGNIGGIVIGHADGVEEGEIGRRLREVPAAVITGTGINRNLALLAASGSAFLGKPQPIRQADDWQSVSHLGGQGMIAPAANRGQPGGEVAFSDNMVTFDAQSQALTLSLDDVGMHDNHAALDLGNDLVLVNALVVGLFSTREQGNRFRETLRPLRSSLNQPLPQTLFSAVTLGLLNATEMNQGDFCFLTIGAKKPRIRMVEERPVLDTNRHTLPDGLCAKFFALSAAFGTD